MACQICGIHAAVATNKGNVILYLLMRCIISHAMTRADWSKRTATVRHSGLLQVAGLLTQPESLGLDGFAHMGLITQLLE